MDSIKNGFKSRIKALMTRNKQLDSEIENNDSEVKKTALKDEKENNNNELRQVRSQKYEYEQINEDVCYIK